MIFIGKGENFYENKKRIKKLEAELNSIAQPKINPKLLKQYLLERIEQPTTLPAEVIHLLRNHLP